MSELILTPDSYQFTVPYIAIAECLDVLHAALPAPAGAIHAPVPVLMFLRDVHV